jgi:tetratricopeptide (TPR) repeat protein
VAVSPPLPQTTVDRSSVRWIAGGLVAAALIAYANSLSAALVLDDQQSIIENPVVRRLWAAGPLTSSDATTDFGSRPLTNLTFAVNYAIGGFDVRGYHIVNALLHALAGIALFGCVRRTLLLPTGNTFASETWRNSLRTHATSLGAIAAGWWLLHPVQTAAVAYLSQRTEILMGACFLVTFYCFIRHVASPHPRTWLSLSVIACLLGMASKEVMITAPFMIFCYDRAFVAGSAVGAWRQRWHYYVSLGTTWILLAYLMAPHAAKQGVGFGQGVAWWRYALTECHAVVHYARLAIWPHPLVFDYGAMYATGLSEIWPQLLTLSIALTGTLWLVLRHPKLGFPACWFFVILAPTSTVVPIALQPIAENRLYLPLAAVTTLAALGTHWLVGRIIFPLFAALALALTLLTQARNHVYGDALGLWADTVSQRPENPRALASYALALSEAGRNDAAIPFFEKSLRLDSRSSATEQNLVAALLQSGRVDDALVHARRAVVLEPASPGAHNCLGVTLLQRGQLPEAVKQFQAAVDLNPNDVAVHLNLGRTHFALGHFAESLVHYQAVLRLSPNSPDALYNVGFTLVRLGKIDEATRYFGAALEQWPNPAGFFNYGIFLANAGRTADAAVQFEHALQLRPAYSEAKDALERLRAGSWPKADFGLEQTVEAGKPKN